jgi:prephenate dehydratase
MRVAYLGPEGTFSHEVLTRDGATRDAALVSCATVRDAVLAVQSAAVERAVVPIENSLEGAVNATLDTLVFEAPDTWIVAETVLAVRHCLVAAGPVDFRSVDRVISHPQASAQCSHYLRAHLPHARVLAATSTADAVRSVAVQGDPSVLHAAAIGTRAAAQRYGATILAEGVEDDPGNETRFVWLARAPVPEAADRPAHPKTSIVFWGAGTDAPGWLVRCLSEFAFRGVNLTRIESRPRRDRLGSYVFFLDMDGHLSDAPVADAVAALGAQADVVRVLGAYPAARPATPARPAAASAHA